VILLVTVKLHVVMVSDVLMVSKVASPPARMLFVMSCIVAVLMPTVPVVVRLVMLAFSTIEVSILAVPDTTAVVVLTVVAFVVSILAIVDVSIDTVPVVMALVSAVIFPVDILDADTLEITAVSLVSMFDAVMSAPSMALAYVLLRNDSVAVSFGVNMWYVAFTLDMSASLFTIRLSASKFDINILHADAPTIFALHTSEFDNTEYSKVAFDRVVASATKLSVMTFSTSTIHSPEISLAVTLDSDATLLMRLVLVRLVDMTFVTFTDGPDSELVTVIVPLVISSNVPSGVDI